MNLFKVNRGYNDLFNAWLEEHYAVRVSTASWSYGEETYVERATGEHVLDAVIMQKYVKTRMPYFVDTDEVDEWLEDYAPLEEYFARRAKR